MDIKTAGGCTCRQWEDIRVGKLDMYSINGGVAVGFNPPRVIGALAAPDRAVAMALFTKWLSEPVWSLTEK